MQNISAVDAPPPVHISMCFLWVVLYRHYNLTSDGCLECGCDVYGTMTSSSSSASAAASLRCDNVTGTCQCRANTEGTRCDTCRPGTRHLFKQRCMRNTTCFVVKGEENFEPFERDLAIIRILDLSLNCIDSHSSLPLQTLAGCYVWLATNRLSNLPYYTSR